MTKDTRREISRQSKSSFRSLKVVTLSWRDERSNWMSEMVG